jgi:hypothetical protein
MLLDTEPKGAMVFLSYPILYALAPLAVLLFMSCAPTHPVTEAVCVTMCRDTFRDTRVLVWSSDPAIEQLLLVWAREQEAHVVDPAQVQDAIRQHRLILEPKPGLEEELRYLGRLVGADRILVAAVMPQSHPLYVMYSGYTEGHPRVTTLFDPTVTVRSLMVNRPTVYWSVTAMGPTPTFALEPTVTDLTQTALRRASCEADFESQWTDATGCVKKQ